MDKRIIEIPITVDDPILIVSDYVDQRSFFQEELEKFGFPCEDSHNGYDALRKAQIKKYSLLIAESMMPKMHGHTLIIEFRKVQLDILVFLHTAFGQEAEYLEGMDLVELIFINSSWELILAVKTLLLKAQSLNKQQSIETNFIKTT